MTTTYLVTGGAGFIGSHLVESLLTEGFGVKVFDNFSTGFEYNITDLPLSLLGNVEIIRGDIRDERALSDAMQGVAGVFHLAALVSVPLSIEQPNLSLDVNTRGTQIVLDVARKNRVKRVVMASSAAVYGNNQNLPLKESEPSQPLSPYGLDKSFGEQLGCLYAELYQMNVSCMRFFNVYGPRQPPDSPYSGVVSIFAKKAAAHEGAAFYGDGEQTRDFIFVKDVANALKLAMHSVKLGFHIYNVGSGTETTVRQLWSNFCQISDFSADAKLFPDRDGDIKKSLANISKIQSHLGFVPSSDFVKNLRETFEWLTSSSKRVSS